ncbi:synapse-associated protein 1-like isoform X2 [Schistocerca americana]|uniref:synapse-associated protein 1-like isoform X2 n=1 Tax=Schistocerca americana TaxID=7009 RepID=UPI001F4FB408|nr:synapse-associated protein 1-like isoform X2 [Schistocerca americana]XP_046987032.1 synapse-associated protein 1-like isoform X2 [Schistocerca americana]XP_047102504.1 synapse-associated protein 1 isoform X2 [Schistocerca piceifrons]XP_049805324.1 synapse-associated protein 1 isoform X2 [Schistocerca nitens]
MFSGLTNQVSSWMGGTAKKDGDPQKSEEENLSPHAVENDVISNTEAENKKDSPTKGSKLEMLGNVKSQMTSWLGSGVLGGLRKGDPSDPNATTGQQPSDQSSDPAQQTSTSEKPAQDTTQETKEDDDSSATGGADSDVAASEPGTPVEDKEGGQPFGAVSTKALQGAKSIGSFLFSAVNKAGKTVSEASAKIKKTVEENSLLGDFNKEQESFIKEKQSKGAEPAFPPWVGCANEESLKEECLTLSTDRRTFVRSPPAGVDFHFDYEVSYPVAMATLAEDPNLEKMRFELVPKVISEENFWRNYFYRVSLIRQANELSSMVQEQGENASKPGSVDVAEPTAKPQPHEVPVAEQAPADSPSHEFVSDTFQASSRDLEEVREGMKKLGMDPDKRNEEWEKELEAELQDYEVVADGDSQQDSNWENQIEEMLDAEDTTDLK